MSPTAGATKTASPVWHVTDAKRSRSTRPALAVVAVLAALVLVTVGIALGRASAKGSSAGAVERQQSQPKEAGTPGSTRTESGAVTAATAHLLRLMSREYVTDPKAREETVRAIAPPAQRERLAAEVADPVPHEAPGGFAAAFGPQDASAWRLTPIGYRVESFAPDAAVVEIWAVHVLAGTGSVDAPSTATWTTARMPMMWVENEWKLDIPAMTAAPGPTPGVGLGQQSPDLDVVAADGLFERYRHAVV